jgi:hypothetical protein
MHFVVYALDKPGSGDIRAAHRDAHRARLREPGQPLKVVTAGPMLDDAKMRSGRCSSSTQRGYRHRAGVRRGRPLPQAVPPVETVDIRPFSWTIGAPAA